MILTHIIAMSENRVIGKDNKLPWHIPEDLKFFREKTKNHIIIMGRKTFDSIQKPLPHRHHIIITRNKPTNNPHTQVDYVGSIDEAIAKAKTMTSTMNEAWGDEVFIIGGGEIFNQSMDVVNRIYLTVIHQDYEGDVFYPEFNKNNFTLAEQKNIFEPISFSFQTWNRK